MIINPPVNPAVVTSPYGSRTLNGVENSYHPGIDYKASDGTPVYASADGTVSKSYESVGDESKGIHGYGNRIVIDHGEGMQTTYNHLSERQKDVGASVRQGEQIGLSGHTGYAFGPHVHFEVLVNGKIVDPAQYVTGDATPAGGIASFTQTDNPEKSDDELTAEGIIIVMVVAALSILLVVALRGV